VRDLHKLLLIVIFFTLDHAPLVSANRLSLLNLCRVLLIGTEQVTLLTSGIAG